MSDHIPHLGGIRQCHCGVTIEIVDGSSYEWLSGRLHDCGDIAWAYVNALAEEALSGDQISARILPAAVSVWLRA